MCPRPAVLPLFLAAVLGAAPARAQPEPSGPELPLTGLWGAELRLGPRVQGTLTVDGRGQEAWASLAGFTLPVARTGARVRVQLPGGQGEFVGRLGTGGQVLEGFWIQPPGVTRSAAYATPTTLRAVAPRVWVGEVVPLEDRLSLYLQLAKAPDGTLTGFLRNPELNLGLGSAFQVVADGRDVVLVSTGRRNEPPRGKLTASARQLALALPGLDTVVLTKRDADSAPGFYPRTPAAPQYRYRPPVPTRDGWRTATPQEVGLAPAPLEELVTRLQRSVASDVHTPEVHALLVARHGRLVLEEYFHGYDREQPHDTRSAGKSLAPVLLGMALAQAKDVGVGTPVLQLLPQYREPAGKDPRKQALTLEHLLTMTSGLRCDDNDGDSPGNENTMQAQTAQPDWYRYTLSLPMARAPGGTEAVYCSAGINLLGAVVAARTGLPLLEFFDQRFARPLGISRYHLNLMPGGEAYLAGGIQLRPRDALKLGQLYLSRGRWNGRQLVSAAWVDASVQPHARFSDGHGYGYGWHVREVQVGGRSYRSFSAEGNGGQFVLVLPELDLAVMIAAGNYGDFPTWSRLPEQVLAALIPAAVQRAAPPPQPAGAP